MMGDMLPAEIKKYERALERARKLGFDEYGEHLENIIRELKAIEELDKGFEEDGP